MLTGDMLRRSAYRFPSKSSIRCGERCLSYAELDESANRFAHAILGLGLDRNAKVAMLSRNIPEYGIVFFGASRTGHVLTNVSILYAPEELTYVLDKADAEVLVFDGFLADKVAVVAGMLPKLRKLVCIGDNGAVDSAEDFWSFIEGQPASPPRRRHKGH